MIQDKTDIKPVVIQNVKKIMSFLIFSPSMLMDFALKSFFRTVLFSKT